ncbi:MAG: hypothetical protein D6722_21135, partial [Bacteroidetes bacterium]
MTLVGMPLLWAQQYRTVLFQTERPISVFQSIEDSLGLVWLATSKGLARFDGVSYTWFRELKPLPGGHSLIARPDGGLIALTAQGPRGLHISLEAPGPKPLDATPFPQGEGVLGGYVDDQNQLWCWASGTLFRQIEGGWQRYPLAERPGQRPARLRQVIPDAEGHLWALG